MNKKYFIILIYFSSIFHVNSNKISGLLCQFLHNEIWIWSISLLIYFISIFQLIQINFSTTLSISLQWNMNWKYLLLLYFILSISIEIRYNKVNFAKMKYQFYYVLGYRIVWFENLKLQLMYSNEIFLVLIIILKTRNLNYQITSPKII